MSARPRWSARPARLPHLILGLLFIGIAAWFGLDRLAGAAFEPRTIWPVLLIGLGVAGLSALVPRPPVQPSERALPTDGDVT